MTCWRPTWRNHDRCIWHADVAAKPVDELADARTEGGERLDGAILREANLGVTVSFANCVLLGADLRGTDLRNAHLTDADLRGADLTGADLRGADLTGADLRGADLTDADIREADLTDTHFEGADLTDADLRWATLTDANLEAVDFTDASLEDVDLTDAILRWADLTDATLRWADLTEADLWRADCSGTNLEYADLTGADLRYTTFVAARLHETHLDEARCNAETGLRDVHAYDLRELHPAGVSTWTDRLRINAQLARHYLSPERDSDVTDPAKAVRVHRKLQQLLRENALPGGIPHHYVREKHARRRQAIVEGDYLKWGYAALQRWVMGYGESPWRVVGTSLAIIVGSALLYPIWGLTVAKASAPIGAVEYGTPPAAPVYELGKSLYFSVITFTTLGYGDIQPRGFAEMLATVESFLGALLMALLVAVLARRITR